MIRGTLTGWDDTRHDLSLSSKTVSIQELIDRYIALKKEFPPELIRDLHAIYQHHLQDAENPHKVTFGQLTGNPIEAIFSGYFTGVVPDVSPAFFYDAMFEDLVDVQVQRESSLYVVDHQGYLQEVPPNTFAVDHTYDLPMIPVFPRCTNHLPHSLVQDLGDDGVCWNTTLTEDPGILDPLRETNHRVVTEGTSIGHHGYQVLGTVTPGTVTTTSMFLYPIIDGYLSWVYVTDEGVIYTTLMTMTVPSRDVVHKDPDHTVIHHVYPSGWCRVGVTSKEIYETPLTLCVIYHDTPTIQAYTGLERPLFALYGFQVQQDTVMGPYTPTYGTPATTEATVVTFTLDPLQLTEFMVTAALYIPTALDAVYEGVKIGTQLHSMLERTSVNYRIWPQSYTDTGYTTRSHPFIPETITHTAISYRKDQVKITSDIDGSKVYDIDGVSPREITEIQVGSYPGYLKMIGLYPIYDTSSYQDHFTGATS